VAQYFPPASKTKAEELVANLLKAYDQDIRSITWMTDTTRQKALEKLHAFMPHIGYPEKWRDYSGLQIKRNDLIGDVERSDIFEWRYRLDRIDQPVDRSEWNMTPPTINAYYTPLFNSIFFPPPFCSLRFLIPMRTMR
jgi:putative endopeptidase